MLDEEKLEENLNMIEEIYSLRQEKLGKCTKELQGKLNDITLDELQKVLEKSIESTERKNEALKQLDSLIENYEMKMARYVEESYKQGFKDAFNLFIECEKN